MKKNYESPRFELATLAQEDVLTASIQFSSNASDNADQVVDFSNWL